MKVFKVKGIKIFYDEKLDGGGTSFGQLYVPIIRRLIGKSKTCFEAFSGPAFIGFSLLAHGLCEELVVADINPEAINYVKLTVNENKLEDKVRYYISDVLDGIPEGEKFDLVVGNPPHFNESTLENYCRRATCDQIDLLKSYDSGWNLHRRFYLNIRKFLNDKANVILVENSEGSNVKDFLEMINEGGLKYVRVIKPETEDIIYTSYIHIRGLNLNVGISRRVKRLPYGIYKLAFPFGEKTHYKPLIDYINFMSKFYFIWSRT
ncbi:methyltransferase [Sulfurisphaera ohwakuensis]|uniref:16S rRNA G966 N2-methylase RsmD n=1 Tax=Sulfurisphaera ohwakuensis TaxID=69656 RepID=A0A650CIP1_SULOH|nr:methyltransferase [Sulfurisphaera ohwakuensis]MBB5253314.1 16S rRNA G966 N2-methylase RsmD [Sulfurisphaera ohwakuensis]QGR17643.1 methyltransferase [Sulfurisphaera ohwakuensis]